MSHDNGEMSYICNTGNRNPNSSRWAVNLGVGKRQRQFRPLREYSPTVTEEKEPRVWGMLASPPLCCFSARSCRDPAPLRRGFLPACSLACALAFHLQRARDGSRRGGGFQELVLHLISYTWCLQGVGTETEGGPHLTSAQESDF